MRNIPTVCAVFLAVAGTSASCAAVQVTLPKGTTVPLRLETNLRAGRDKVGTRVTFTVDQNVYGPNHVLLLAKGAEAAGHVTESVAHGPLGKPGALQFTCDSVRSRQGSQIPLTLTVTAGPSSGPAADAASRTEAQANRPFSPTGLEPDGYVQSSMSGGYYFQTTGVASSLIYDPARFFGSSEDVTAKQGQEYKATVSADAAL